MKNIITITMLILFSNFSCAQNNYDKLWKQVEEHENEGLPKSALKSVEQIEQQAKAENNKPQLIKTLLFKSKYSLPLEENAQLEIINNFKTEIEKSTSPTKNILENVLANLYWQYFQSNRWEFYERTKTENKIDETDFRTWDLETLFNEIHLHFQNSLKNRLILQQTPLKDFDVILNKQKDSKLYRPTLFDFLSHNALEFYKTDENAITKPAYKFKIDNDTYLSDAKTFSTLNITSKDSTSLQLQALKIYQELTAFHLKDKTPTALADVDIERIHFVRNTSTLVNKNELAIAAFKAANERYKNHEVTALYTYEIASVYTELGNEYNRETNTGTRWKLKEAVELCESAVKKFPQSKGAKKCELLKHDILKPNFTITAEKYLPILQPSKLLVDYKNSNTLLFTVYSISQKQYGKLKETHHKEKQLSFIKKLKSVTSWNSALKNEKDYQNHSTEILLPKLNNGMFVILAAPENNDDIFAYTTIQVTDFTLTRTPKNKEETFQLINRLNGQPIANAKIKASYQKNYRGNPSSDNFTTTNLGEFTIKKEDYRLSKLNMEVTHNNQTAYFGNYYINRYYENNTDNNRTLYNSFLFTDRSIYRPGQPVYFKGIAIKTENEKTEVLPNTSITVKLTDVNEQEIKTLNFKTNEFGSFHGEFMLPNGGLTGRFTIEVSSNTVTINDYTNISVEEYKRPKFEAKFNSVTETYRVNDTVTVKGNAMAYAGSTITNAKVVYRVYRQVRYPIWCYWRPTYNSSPQEITHGETQTNNKGEFEVQFKALPDESANLKDQPVFNYEVTAEVTDLNGETRTTNTTVNIGYHSLTAQIIVPSIINKNEKGHKLVINTQNLNGEFAPAKGTLKIYKLIAPKEVLRPRPWKAPDYKTWDEKEFKTLYPYEAYGDESDNKAWKNGELVFSKLFNTEKSKDVALGNIKKWESGLYKIELESKDKFNQTVKSKATTVLFSPKDKTLADNLLFDIQADKKEYDIGNTAEITFGSSAKKLVITYNVEKNGALLATETLTLNNNKKTIKIPLNKNDLGGFVIHYSYAFQNSGKAGLLAINVPYPKTDLEIETSTFRDKLQPNQQETWQFKIKGPKGDKVSAELVASMYDMSLDQFKPHSWQFNPINKPTYYSRFNKNTTLSFGTENFRVYQNYDQFNMPYQYYDRLNWFGLNLGNNWQSLKSSVKYGRNVTVRGVSSMEMSAPAEIEMDGEIQEVIVEESKSASNFDSKQEDDKETLNKPTTFDNIQIRKNLQETAFFFPQLKTDKDGNVSFSFTTPEALTKWKVQLLAHTKTLEHATTTLETVTQKELMVTPNAPRFLRQGDKIIISSKIANISNKNLSGQAKLELTDALTGKPINNELSNSENSKSFSVDKKGNTQISWSLSIPDDIQAVHYKVLAKAGNFSDGEQNALPVLTNRMLVTESLPMWVKSNETKTFTLDKLKTTNSSTLKHHKLTLEMTSNPAWYAVQALPYLMEYPYDCNEQTFSRYYANALASHIANSNPKIKDVFNQWASQDALISNLEKNEELKSLLIQETPWLRDAQSETEQKKRIALLFDLNKMNSELQMALQKLEQSQMSNGAWSWFNGGRPNRFITQHIITGFGHLKQLNVSSNTTEAEMLKKAIGYLDDEFIKEYEDIRKYNTKVDLSKDHLSYTQFHYLYMRSFFTNVKKSKRVQEITAYYQSQIKNYWLSRSLYAKGLMALISHRLDDAKTASKILKSLEENSITNDELGMYWKENTASWYWHQAPIETQALLIEAFSEIKNDTNTIDNLKIWLLKNKQTNKWGTTKATTDAVYALLLQGSDWLSVTDMVDIVLGDKKIDPSKLDAVKVEAGTGYFKTAWTAGQIQPKMAEVKISKKGKGIAWGSLYWQYFEDLDKITSAETPLKLKKKLFKRNYTDKGEELSEITENSKLHIGDLVRVRIELRSDRDMEFVHMKDMRASGLEPVNVISRYKWQDGLGYYESTKDASTNFFFDYLPKGISIFEYDLRVNNAGEFSNGITTIQCMYAPEFTSHSEGLKIIVNSPQ